MTIKEKSVIVTPCFNEEVLIADFLNNLENKLGNSTSHFTIVVVDDCSTDKTLEILKNFKFKSEKFELKIITLNYNLGHQRAIAQGLKYASKFDATRYIVMDSDGEDDPSAIVKLLEIDNFETVFVTRGKRTESLKFKIGYFFYQILFKIISGNTINFGNYSMINHRVLNAINQQSFIHYSAFLSKQKFTIKTLKFARNKRIDGTSKMNTNGLVMHGLKSLIEYSDELLFFFLKISIGIFLSLAVLGCYIIYSKVISNVAIPGWTSILGGTLLNSFILIVGTIILSLLIQSVKIQIHPQSNLYKEVI